MSYPPELVELAARVYADTKSGGEVARRLSVSLNKAYRLLQVAGLRLPHRHSREVNENKRKLHGETATKVAADYAAGIPMAEIRSRYGVGAWAIKTAAKGSGVPERPRGGKVKTFTDEHLAEASRLYATGMSQPQIAAHFHMGLNTVSRALRMAGVDVRSRKARGSTHHAWKGGRIITGDGYFKVLVGKEDPLFLMADSGGYVLEHRIVMARALGRPLIKSETVHHINGDKSNNKLSNLQLRFGRHGKGVAMTCAACGSRDISYSALAD